MPFRQAFEPFLCPQQQLPVSELSFQQMLCMQQQVQTLRQCEQNVRAGLMPKRSDLQSPIWSSYLRLDNASWLILRTFWLVHTSVCIFE